MLPFKLPASIAAVVLAMAAALWFDRREMRSIDSMLLLHSKSIIKSSEQIDSHGDSVSSDSARDITIDCRGLTCGAYELFALLLCDVVGFRLIDADLADDVFSSYWSVGVSTIECNCVFDAINSQMKLKKKKKKI